jgi:hypothetical protein
MNTFLIENLLVSYSNDDFPTHFSYANTIGRYDAYNLELFDSINMPEDFQVDNLYIDPNGSQILVLETSQALIYYQQLSNGEFIDISPQQLELNNAHYESIHILEVMLPEGEEINGVFQRLPLRIIDNDTITRFKQYFRPLSDDNYSQMLAILNNAEPIIEKSLEQLSYETYIKGISGVPIILPEYLIINGLKVNFIPFDQIRNIQIDRYTIDPILQPWGSVPYGAENKILTIFGKNGITYMVKARYDPVSNHIFSPL